MTPGSSQRTVAAGFTLVELIVVIVLMGVMAAMIVPEMRGTYGDERSAFRPFLSATSTTFCGS